MRRIICSLLLITLLVSYAVVPAKAESAITKEAILSALYESDIVSMRTALSAGLVTSEELTAYYLERIEAYNAPYNCFITICDDALEVARERDGQMASGNGDGLLFGIPVVIKDNMDLVGFHTTNGYKKEDDQIADENAAVVDALLAEGAVIIAKTNMSKGAQDALRSYSAAVGETMNAYSTYMAAGGSSGGSAVATSLNFAAASLGTDTNSSLRIPAALSGCVSLRPTFGLLSRDGIKRLNSKRDTAGAITRTVYDQAIMMDVLTGGAYQYTENLNINALSGMRLGVLKQLSYATTKTGLRSEANIDDEVAAAFENALAELRACGAEIVEVSFPSLFTLSEKTFADDPVADMDKLNAAFEEVLAEYDVEAVLYPSYLSTPIRSGTDADGKKWDAYSQTNINNCRTLSPSARIPEISLPIGVHSLGAGIGMEIAGPRNSEQLLLDIAYAYTSQYDHRTIPSGAPDIYANDHVGDLQSLILVSNQPEVETTAPTEPPADVDIPEETLDEPDGADDIGRQIPWWPFALLFVLVILLLIAIRKKRQQRRRRRRRQPVFQK